MFVGNTEVRGSIGEIGHEKIVWNAAEHITPGPRYVPDKMSITASVIV